MINIVYSDYYSKVTDEIVNTIINKNDSYKSDLSSDKKIELSSYRVNGVWEIPYKINNLSKDCKHFIAVGVVIKGDTDHYEYLSTGVINALMNLTINKNVYIANCILNVHNLSQAEARSESKGIEAFEATLNIMNNE